MPLKVRKLLTDLLHGHETENAKSHPMLVSRPVNKTAYIVITSDRGLVEATMPPSLKP